MMKKLLLYIFIISMGATVSAQKGSMYIGGGAAYNDGDWRLAPELGTWLSDDLQLGLVSSYSKSTVGSIFDPNESSVLAPHLYLRKWKSISEDFSLYVGLNARYSYVKLTSSFPNSSVSDSIFDGFLDFGFAFAIAPRWGMVGRVASIGYINENFDLDINLSPGSMFNVGLYYTFKE